MHGEGFWAIRSRGPKASTYWASTGSLRRSAGISGKRASSSSTTIEPDVAHRPSVTADDKRICIDVSLHGDYSPCDPYEARSSAPRAVPGRLGPGDQAMARAGT